jgi:RND superfamily putative drug exporter
MLYRFGLLVGRHARLVLILGALLFVGSAVLGAGAFGHLSSGGFDDPSAESTRANALAAQHFGPSPNLIMVGTADDGAVDSAASAAAGRRLTADLAAEPGVTVQASYWTTPIPALRSTDGRSGLILAVIAGDQGTMVTRGGQLIDAYGGDRNGLTVRSGGPAGIYGDINAQVTTSLVRAESVAIPLTLLLLVLVFGSVVAALLPLLIGGCAIVGTFAELAVLGRITDVSVFAINLTTALGLGLGIDYGLLIVARFREQLAAGDDVATAVARTVATAGRTILFSAAAVACALATLMVFPLFFLSSFGYAGVGVVVVAAVSALTITPAALALLGARVDKGKVPLIRGSARGGASPFWKRVAGTVFHRPVRTAVPVLLILLLAASPILGIRFSLPDQTVLPQQAQSRQVADLLATQFPAQSAATIPVILDGPADPSVAAAYAIEFSRLPGVTRVAAVGMTATGGVAGPADPTVGILGAGGWQRLVVVTDVHAGTRDAQTIVTELRAVPVATGAPGSGASTAPAFLVGGGDAALLDTLDAIGRPLPLALAIIVITTFLLLFLFTGSLVQPLRALVVNSISLCAALGIVTWIFQDGHLIGLFGATARPMDASMTVLLLSITFGLSMDYEVFLSSRITELYHSGSSLEESVTNGLARTGRIVTSAALLLAVSFFAFTFSTVSMLQLFGLGAGLAVIIDATLVRGVLVPAAMRLIGRANFWAPRLLRRVYARVGLAEE